MDVEPFHQLRAVGLDRFHAKIKTLRDLLRRASLRDQLENYRVRNLRYFLSR